MKKYRRTTRAVALFACLTLIAGGLTPTIAAPPETEAAQKVAAPPALASFVKASNERDTESLVTCFTKDAIVYDQGEILRGAEEVRHWIADGFKKYEYVVAPTGVKNAAKVVVLTTVVTGTFPGGRAALDFHCRIDGDKIAVMVVQPTPAPVAAK
jgi:hypothetical protein